MPSPLGFDLNSIQAIARNRDLSESVRAANQFADLSRSVNGDMTDLSNMAAGQAPMTTPIHEPSFVDTLRSAITDVNTAQVQADRDVQSMIAGKPIDAHQVMLSVEKANISFDLVMEVRNKLLDAYREIMKTPV
jgi:flagellar hook-basal body complex protein FliE